VATIDETGLRGRIRDQRISDKLRRVLLSAAAAAGIDTVRVTSGGQPGSTGRRVGSTRHDHGNAADLELVRNGRVLNFTDPSDRRIVEEFVTAAAAHGAIGIGAGVDYMGPTRLHVGFGRSAEDHARLVWGAGGSSANAPTWLREAAGRGWRNPATHDEVGEDDIEVVSSSFSDLEPTIDEPMRLLEGLRERLRSTSDDGMTADPEVTRFRPLLDFIARHEVGTTGPEGYNISLAQGELTGGEKDLVNMTLDQIDALQRRMLLNRFNSSALGRYQILRATLRSLRRKLGLPASQKFSRELQDRLAVALIKGRGRSVPGLRSEWASLKNVSADEILRKYDEDGRHLASIEDDIRNPAGPSLSPAITDTMGNVRSGRVGTELVRPVQSVDEDEQDLGREAEALFENADAWLSSPHPGLGGRSPQECLKTGEEQPVRQLLRRIKYVPYT